MGFLGEKLILDYVHKNVKFCMQFFFVKFIFWHKLAAKKRIKNFFPQIFIFVYEKNAYHTIFIYENFMISIFLTEIKIMFLIVIMPFIIDILI